MTSAFMLLPWLQGMLRQIAFGKLHSVLGVESLTKDDATPTKRPAGSNEGTPAAKVMKTE